MMTRHEVSWWLHLHWPIMPNWLDRPLARLAIRLNV